MADQPQMGYDTIISRGDSMDKWRADSRWRTKMIEDLKSQADDLYFARHSGETDAVTRAEIEADLNRFAAKINSRVQAGELTPSIGAALKKIASR